VRQARACAERTSPSRDRFRIVLLLALSSAFLAAGCKKSQPERLTPAKIHAITRELANAAHSAAPPGTEIRIGLQASEKTPGTPDTLYITLAKGAADSAAKSDAVEIQRALTTVATRHGLTEEILEGSEGVVFFYLKNGVRTHSIQIHLGAVAAEHRQGSSAPRNGAKLAIILDDLGNDRRAAEEIFDLHYPLTISVLPNQEHSQEIAQEAERRGYQVMLHLPMQAVSTEKPEAQELRPGMAARQVSKLVNQFLQDIPGAVGVNNHQGSEATSDPALMRELMPVLRDHHLFYIDSRTTAATVAYETAQSSRVPSAFRNVPFLDDVAEVGAVRKQLELALRGAREKGEAVAIGHPHPATLQALREVLPNAQSEGVRLALASELVH
jgi:uncharacterized protein